MSSSHGDTNATEGPGSGAPNRQPGLAGRFTSLAGTDLREGDAEVGEVRLHYVEAGDGPLIVLLHGFPEFWFGWRLQIAPLAAAGFRVVAPDLRGYNLSSKPAGLDAYTADRLATDIRGLIRERRRRIRAGGRSRLGRNRRLDHGYEPPRGGRPPGHPQRGPSAAAEPGAEEPASAHAVLVLLLLPASRAARAPCARRHWRFFRRSCATPARRTRTRRSIATSRRGPSPGRRPAGVDDPHHRA